MLSKSILKQSIKNNWKLWAILTGILCFFITVTTFAAMSGGDMGPPRAEGGRGVNVMNMYEAMFFGMMGIMMLLIYAIAAGNKLVASEVDKGTMSFTLNTPTTRKQIIFSKVLFYITSIVLMAVLMGLFGTVASLITGTEIDYGTLWMMVFGFILFGLATSSICFAASCWFNKGGQSLLIGAGLPVGFYLLNAFSGLLTINGNEFLKYFSINTLFDTAAIATGSGFIIQFIAMGVIAIALYFVGIRKFLRKDLPL